MSSVMVAFILGLSIGIVGMLAVLVLVLDWKNRKIEKYEENGKEKWTYVGVREKDSHRS